MSLLIEEPELRNIYQVNFCGQDWIEQNITLEAMQPDWYILLQQKALKVCSGVHGLDCQIQKGAGRWQEASQNKWFRTKDINNTEF